MTRRYSALALIREGLSGHKGWRPAWRSPELKPAYDFVVVGGGGHGLATAYYLAKNHGAKRVAVIEKGWLGGGNTGRNTTIVRSNYFYPESVALYDFALRLYERLSRDLNYNVMLSQRGVATVAHSDAEMEIAARLVNAMRINGVDAELLTREQILAKAPLAQLSAITRAFPSSAASGRGAPASPRHDAVAWGYARAADALGVDIVQSCEVEAFLIEGGRCVGVETSHGDRARRCGRPRGRPDIRACWRRRRVSDCRCAPTRCRRWCPSR